MDGKNNNKIFANASSSFRSTVNLWIHQKNQSQNQNQNKEMETHWMLPQRMAENNTNLNFYWMNSKSRGVDTQMGRFNPINYETGLYKCEDVCVCVWKLFTHRHKACGKWSNRLRPHCCCHCVCHFLITHHLRMNKKDDSISITAHIVCVLISPNII